MYQKSDLYEENLIQEEVESMCSEVASDVSDLLSRLNESIINNQSDYIFFGFEDQDEIKVNDNTALLHYSNFNMKLQKKSLLKNICNEFVY